MKCTTCGIDIKDGEVLCENCLKQSLPTGSNSVSANDIFEKATFKSNVESGWESGLKSGDSVIEILKALHSKLTVVSKNTDDSADALRKELTATLLELDKCIALLQIENRFSKSDNFGSGLARELHRTTSQPLSPPDKKSDPYRVDFGF